MIEPTANARKLVKSPRSTNSAGSRQRPNSVSRRTFLRTATLVGLTAWGGVLTACSSPAGSSAGPTAGTGPTSPPAAAVGAGSSTGGALNVLTYGGPVAEVQRELVIPVMQQKYGTTVNLTEGTVIASRLNAEIDRPTYGLFTENVLFQPTFARIWVPLTASDIPNAKNVYPELLKGANNRGIPAWVHSACIVYDERRFSSPPTLDDFKDPKNKAKIALQATPLTVPSHGPMIMQWTGATIENPQPMFDWFKAVIPNRLTDYQQVTQPAQLFQSGDVWLALWYSGRAAQLRYSGGVPVKWVNEGAIAVLIAMGLVPGGGNPEAGKRYIDTWLDPQVQGTMAARAGFAPVVNNAQLTDQQKQQLPIQPTEMSKLLIPDWAALAPHLTQWQARYDELVQQG